MFRIENSQKFENICGSRDKIAEYQFQQMAASAIDRKFNSPTLRKTSRGPPSFTPPATIREMGGEREDDLYSGAAENQNGNMKLKRWLSVSVDDLQVN